MSFVAPVTSALILVHRINANNILCCRHFRQQEHQDETSWRTLMSQEMCVYVHQPTDVGVIRDKRRLVG